MHTHSLLGECACSDSEGWNDLDNQEPEGLRVQFGDKALAKHVEGPGFHVRQLKNNHRKKFMLF